MARTMAAEVFPPGEFIKEELEARGWSQIDLAEILGRAPHDVSQIITGKRSITPLTAKVLADAFGTSAELWLNLESAYQLDRVKDADDAVAQRAKLYEKMPIREMVRRCWIEYSEDVEVLKRRALTFLEMKSIEDEPTFLSHAARKSTAYETATAAQLAWLHRAKKLVSPPPARKFTDRSFNEGLVRLKALIANAEDIRRVPQVLSEMGIRFLVLEPLPGTKVDGVCFWLTKQSPVIVLSLRYDRIDWFWHTLLHELAHVRNRDGLNEAVTIDTDLVGDESQSFKGKLDSEKRADEFATQFSVPDKQLEHFIARVRPLYSQKKIQGFATRVGVHPGIVVGQLQYRKEISYGHSRRMLLKVRNTITRTALTDGWGHTPPIISNKEQ
jgi:HTH-type transcriptional regulator/antitoxin HigA